MTQTPEQLRAYKREYYLRNREKIREQQRVYRQTLDPDQQRAYMAEWYAANRESQLAKGRDYRRREDPERRRAYNREYYRRTRDAQLARAKERYRTRSGREYIRAYRTHSKHGMQPEDWAAMWDVQAGRCYLCGCQLTTDGAVIDHDHSCCPAESSCRICRRGLSCSNCNVAVGMVGDDPARLRRMADALEAAQLLVDQRKAEAGERLTLF